MLKIKVKELVDAKFDNINQFAKAIGIGYQPAENIYNGTVSRIGLDTLDAICTIFDCTPNDILISDKIKTESENNTLKKQKNIIRVYHAQNAKQKNYTIKTEDSPTNDSVSIPTESKKEQNQSQLHKIICEIVNQEIDRKMGISFMSVHPNLKEEMHEQSWRNVIKEKPDPSKGGK